jgi:hypothetical protein
MNQIKQRVGKRESLHTTVLWLIYLKHK